MDNGSMNTEATQKLILEFLMSKRSLVSLHSLIVDEYLLSENVFNLQDDALCIAGISIGSCLENLGVMPESSVSLEYLLLCFFLASQLRFSIFLTMVPLDHLLESRSMVSYSELLALGQLIISLPNSCAYLWTVEYSCHNS